MQWCVVKQGAEMFDALHAYGLGIVLACAHDAPIQLTDEGTSYRLCHRTRTRPRATMDILDRVLPLPTLGDLLACEKNPIQMSLPMMILDGLLAALFTCRGTRLLSVADLFLPRRPASQRRVNLLAAREGLTKVHTAITRWKEYARRQSPLPSEWLESVLKDYDELCPTIPLPAKWMRGDIGIWMTIEPSYSLSTRRPLSDGCIMDKVNLTITRTRCAAFLALIGATRFLRAQWVAGRQVNLYVPLAASMLLSSQAALRALRATGHTAGHALALQWLSHISCQEPLISGTPSLAKWNGLAYQVLQTQQGVRQAISCQRGCLDYAWAVEVADRAGVALIDYWKSLLGHRLDQAPFEMDSLVDCLTHHRMEDWWAHLQEMALALHSLRPRGVRARPYHLREMKEVTAMMSPSSVPLNAVLEREQGTLRFGHALRLLGRHTATPLRDVVDDLHTVQTRDQLIRVLARAAQECTVATAKSPFIIVPTDEDLRYLLVDVDRYGARTIASLLIILSALRYPPCRLPDEPSVIDPLPPGGSAPSKSKRRKK